MKKLLALLLAFAMLFSCAAIFVSCDDSDSYEDDDDEKKNDKDNKVDGKDDKDDGNKTDSDKENDDNATASGTDLSKLNVTYATPFSEGKAFVRNGEEYNRLHCIDTTGKILFTVTHPNEQGYLYVAEGFYNGIAALDFNTVYGAALLCDVNGNIIEPSSVGADMFMISETDIGQRELFKAGYFCAKKTTTTFTGTKDEYALFNSDFEKIIDFTESFTSSEAYYTGETIYKNYVLDIGSGMYLNLETGVEGRISDLLSSITLDHPSDAWDNRFSTGSWDGYYDLITGELVVDLSEYADTLEDCGKFEDGYAPLTFTVYDSIVGQKKFFTVLNESGEFEFDPIEIYAYYNVKYYHDGTYVLYALYDTDTHKIAVVDVEGNLKEITLEAKGTFYQVLVKYTDECIMFKEAGSVKYYNFKLEQIL